MYVSSGNSDRNICNTFVSVLFFVLTGTRPMYLVYTYPRGCNSETHRSSLGILALVVTLSDDAIRSICRICPRPSPPNLCSLVGPARLCARLAPHYTFVQVVLFWSTCLIQIKVFSAAPRPAAHSSLYVESLLPKHFEIKIGRFLAKI